MLDKYIERCFVFRANCRNNKLFSCDYLYVCDVKEDLKAKVIRYCTTPHIMYADKLYYKPDLERICDYINKDMQNYEEKLKFEIVLVQFTTIVEEVEDKGE